MADKKYIDIKEFRELGYLQEINRLFLHPLGLALEVMQLTDGTERLSGVWDSRDDPEGIYFGDGMIDEAKIAHVSNELGNRAPERFKALGFTMQPPDRQRLSQPLPDPALQLAKWQAINNHSGKDAADEWLAEERAKHETQ